MQLIIKYQSYKSIRYRRIATLEYEIWQIVHEPFSYG